MQTQIFKMTSDRREMQFLAFAVRDVFDGLDDGTRSRISFVGRPDVGRDEFSVALAQTALGQGIDVVAPVFRARDGEASPIGYEVLKLEDNVAYLYGECVLWSGDSAGNAVLVPPFIDVGAKHFVAAGGRLEIRDGWPADDLAEGMQRAAERVMARYRELRM